MSVDVLSTLPLGPRLRAVLASPVTRLILLGLLAAAAVYLFMTIQARGNWSFIIPFRGRKVLAMIAVGYAIAVSTVMFQTITGNRILTPSIMGFDALYMLIQTSLVFFLGGFAYATFDPTLRFVIDVAVMVTFSGGLYWLLFLKNRRSLHLVVLVGIVFGTLFRSASNMMQRMMDPTQFAILQDAGFATFNTIDQALLGVAAVVIAGTGLFLWRYHHVLDVLALGREQAISLGIDYERKVMAVLAVVTVLVSLSTALVGPVTFLGLIVANVAYALINSPKHRHALPAAVCLAMVALIAGQAVLERVFAFNTSLSVIIEFAGGLLFIVMLVRGAVR